MLMVFMCLGNILYIRQVVTNRLEMLLLHLCQNYTTSKEGEVYVITNKAWDGWVKIGMAVDAEDRLNSYQTSSPHRDYILIHKEFFSDRRRAEAQAHIEGRKS